MKKRKLGSQGLEVAELGLGCMGMSDFYGKADEAESVATIHRALELGVTLLDTADMYGFGENERLVGRAIRGRRDRVVLATKFGILATKEDSAFGASSGKPEYVKQACEGSLQATRGRRDRPLLHPPRRPTVPIEDTIGAMSELVARREGALHRHLRGGPGDDPPRAPGAPDVGAADRVLALEPRPGGRPAAARARARDRVRRLQPDRPRISDRHDHSRSTTSPQTTSAACQPRLQRGQPREKHRARGAALRDRRREGLHARAAVAGLGARPGRRRRPDPRHDPAQAPRGKHRRRRHPTLSPKDMARIDATAHRKAASGDRYADMNFVDIEAPPK